MAGNICFGRPAGRQPAEVEAVGADQGVPGRAKSMRWSTRCPLPRKPGGCCFASRNGAAYAHRRPSDLTSPVWHASGCPRRASSVRPQIRPGAWAGLGWPG